MTPRLKAIIEKIALYNNFKQINGAWVKDESNKKSSNRRPPEDQDGQQRFLQNRLGPDLGQQRQGEE